MDSSEPIPIEIAAVITAMVATMRRYKLRLLRRTDSRVPLYLSLKGEEPLYRVLTAYQHLEPLGAKPWEPVQT